MGGEIHFQHRITVVNMQELNLELAPGQKLCFDLTGDSKLLFWPAYSMQGVENELNRRFLVIGDFGRILVQRMCGPTTQRVTFIERTWHLMLV